MKNGPAFAQRLLYWFDRHGRKHLPWAVGPTPYRVWVSEIMLQQTQVGTVIAYFERFVRRFPDVRTVAAASADEVLHLWTGLGYYARARHLHACAQILTHRYGGEFPRSIEALGALPGIGRSTAGAILAIAHGDRHAILDGNVKRVLARHFGIAGDPSRPETLKRLWERAEHCTPLGRIADYTQAIMDLGATVCVRARPACTLCPLRVDCVAAREGRQAELPERKRRRERGARDATLLIAQIQDERGDAILLERRPERGVWGGLWSPPEFASAASALEWCRREIGEPADAPQALPPIEHALTHLELRLQPVRVRCRAVEGVREGGDQLWYRLQEPPRVGLPQPIRALFERLLGE